MKTIKKAALAAFMTSILLMSGCSNPFVMTNEEPEDPLISNQFAGNGVIDRNASSAEASIGGITDEANTDETGYAAAKDPYNYGPTYSDSVSHLSRADYIAAYYGNVVTKKRSTAWGDSSATPTMSPTVPPTPTPTATPTPTVSGNDTVSGSDSVSGSDYGVG